MDRVFQIVFTDNTMYEGGTEYTNSKWLEIPKNKTIRSLFYRLPYGDTLVLSGYSQFCQLIEVTKDLNGDNAGTLKIEYIYLIGFIKNKGYIVYKINIKSGNIDRIELNLNDKWVLNINKEGWR